MSNMPDWLLREMAAYEPHLVEVDTPGLRIMSALITLILADRVGKQVIADELCRSARALMGKNNLQ